MNFTIVSRNEIESGLLIREPHVIISISDPESQKPRIRETGSCKGVLRLRFHDAEPVEDFDLPDLPGEIRLMTPGQAQAIWQFILPRVTEITMVLVHCELGMSRSPAVAAAICLGLGGLGEDSTRFFEEYQPNQFVYRLVLAEAPAEPPVGPLGAGKEGASG
jgi:predicted protein tyrosine phosphatase